MNGLRFKIQVVDAKVVSRIAMVYVCMLGYSWMGLILIITYM